MKQFLFLLVIIFNAAYFNAQTCSACSTSITGNDTSSYVVNAGKTLCIDTTGNFSGNITLNGGTICNKGVFSPKTFILTSGTLNNLNNTILNLQVNVASNFNLLNQGGAVLTIKGSLFLGGGSLSNDGILNIEQGITNGSGIFSNTNIINCTQFTGSNAINNSGVINTN